MKLTVEMSDLKKHVNYVRNGLGASKTDLPTMLIRWRVKGNTAVMFAAGKEMWCRTKFPVQRPEGEDEEGSFAVLGSRMTNLINQIETEQITMEIDPENVQIQAGYLTVNFETFDDAALKSIEQGIMEHAKMEGLVIERGAFEEALSCARACTTTNSIRPNVTHVEIRGGRMLSSDGRKIMIYSNDGFPEALHLKVPSTTLADLLAAVKNIDATHVEMAEGDSYYYLKAEKNRYSAGIRMTERDFPAVEEQIQSQAKPTDSVTIDKHVLEGMLRGVALGLPTDEVRVTINLEGTGEEASLEVSATNGAGRRSHEKAACGRTAKKTAQFPISFKHLLDTVGVFKGDSVIDMDVLQTKNLLMVRDANPNREVLTIIPFRTDKAIEEEKKEAAAAEEARKKTDAIETEEGEEAAAGAAEPEPDLGDLE